MTVLYFILPSPKLEALFLFLMSLEFSFCQVVCILIKIITCIRPSQLLMNLHHLFLRDNLRNT